MATQTNLTWGFEKTNLISLLDQQAGGEEFSKRAFTSYKKGFAIYLPEQDANLIYMVVKGSVKICTYSDHGREIVGSILSDGEIFGEEAIIADGVKRKEYAVAQENNTIVYQLNAHSVTRLMTSDPNLGFKLMKLLARKLTIASKEKEIFKLPSAHARLIEFIKELAVRKGKKVGFETMIETKFTHRDMASLIGISRQTVTTILNELKRKNIIYFDRRKILIRDLDKLV